MPGNGGFNRLSASLHVKEGEWSYWTTSPDRFQSPFGITACERLPREKTASTERDGFNRLSASLHVKAAEHVVGDWPAVMFQSPFGITACESDAASSTIARIAAFQTPFGITACESSASGAAADIGMCFKRLSASLHVKARRWKMRYQEALVFQTPFGITACERLCAQAAIYCDDGVSNAFRHHCM